MQCEQIERRLSLYACDELDAVQRAAVEEHLKACPACAAALEREQKMLQALAACEMQEPSPSLLHSCRSALGEAVDDLADSSPWRRWLSSLRPASWLAMHPAWGTALLLLLGVVLGYSVPRWLRPEPVLTPGTPATMAVYAPLSAEELRNADISDIVLVPTMNSGGAPTVEVRLMAQTPKVLQGSPADSQIKDVLTYVLQNNQRFDSGLRLDTVEVLRAQNRDAEVRDALCHVARHDRNPAVRLKALEALRGLEEDNLVRQVFLEALLEDDNPGVRVEAINALRALAEKSREQADPRLVEVLRERMEKDPNTYIRMQSAAAIREMRPREVY